jgi:hypothetical protein
LAAAAAGVKAQVVGQVVEAVTFATITTSRLLPGKRFKYELGQVAQQAVVE